jgi:hypothetical protein
MRMRRVTALRIALQIRTVGRIAFRPSLYSMRRASGDAVAGPETTA